MAFWENSLRYLYLPRLKNSAVLESAIKTGAASSDLFGTAYGEQEGTFEGLELETTNAQSDDTLLLYRASDRALRKERRPRAAAAGRVFDFEDSTQIRGGVSSAIGGTSAQSKAYSVTGAQPRPKSFHLTADVTPAAAKIRLVEISDEIISVLGSDPNASVKITLEISADFPNGITDNVKRAVSENAQSGPQITRFGVIGQTLA